MFYSETVFENWKTENNSAINYKDFSKKTIIDGFVMSENNKKIATFVLRKKINSYIFVRTDNLLQLNEFYNYANHISNALIPKYISKSKKELTLLEKKTNATELIRPATVGDGIQVLSEKKIFIVGDSRCL